MVDKSANLSMTGCCDAFVIMNIISAINHNPHSLVWLWSDANWTEEQVYSRIFRHPRFSFHRINLDVLFANYSHVKDALSQDKNNGTWKYRSIIFADIARYAILYHFGGSYIDLDVYTLHNFASYARRHNIPMTRPIIEAAIGRFKGEGRGRGRGRVGGRS